MSWRIALAPDLTLAARNMATLASRIMKWS